MSLFRLIFIILAIYFAYRFIFHLVLPVYRASKRMQQQFRGMHEQMNGQMDSQPGYDRRQGTATDGQTARNSKPVSKDYIDFEEIKE